MGTQGDRQAQSPLWRTKGKDVFSYVCACHVCGACARACMDCCVGVKEEWVQMGRFRPGQVAVARRSTLQQSGALQQSVTQPTTASTSCLTLAAWPPGLQNWWGALSALPNTQHPVTTAARSPGSWQINLRTRQRRQRRPCRLHAAPCGRPAWRW